MPTPTPVAATTAAAPIAAGSRQRDRRDRASLPSTLQSAGAELGHASSRGADAACSLSAAELSRSSWLLLMAPPVRRLFVLHLLPTPGSSEPPESQPSTSYVFVTVERHRTAKCAKGLKRRNGTTVLAGPCQALAGGESRRPVEVGHGADGGSLRAPTAGSAS